MFARCGPWLVTAAFAVGVAAAWTIQDFPVSPPMHCRIGVPYSVPIVANTAELQLSGDGSAVHYLVVGSLGSSDREYEIVLDGSPSPGPRPIGLTPVQPMPVTPSVVRTRNEPILQVAFLEVDGHTQTVSTASNRRQFDLHVTDGPLDDPRQYTRLNCRLVAEGLEVRVYLDNQLPADRLQQRLANEIVRLIDEDIVPVIGRHLGRCRDVDGDGKFTICLTPWLDRLQGGRTSLGGLVRSGDFHADVQRPFGNQADVLFLNSALQPGRHLAALLAHEYTHAVCFSERSDPRRAMPLPLEDDWLNEALAHVAESVAQDGWTNRASRVAEFLASPTTAPLVVPDYYGAGLWRHNGCRGATFLFLQWCVDRCGAQVLPRIVSAPRQGRQNVEYATGTPFPHLFRWWTLALLEAAVQAQGDGPLDADLPGFTSLRLAEAIGNEPLAGPTITEWNPQSGPLKLRLRGTTAAFIRIPASCPPDSWQVSISGTTGTELQVSLVRTR